MDLCDIRMAAKFTSIYTFETQYTVFTNGLPCPLMIDYFIVVCSLRPYCVSLLYCSLFATSLSCHIWEAYHHSTDAQHVGYEQHRDDCLSALSRAAASLPAHTADLPQMLAAQRTCSDSLVHFSAPPPPGVSISAANKLPSATNTSLDCNSVPLG